MNLEEPSRDPTVQLGEFLGGAFENSRELIQQKLKEHLTTPVNIGVTGVRGSGKSTLIRAITDIFPPDPRAAVTDSIHRTRYPTPYLHPNSENIVFWDCPGLGGIEPGELNNAFDFTQENYFDKISKLDNQEENDRIKERLPNFVIPERVSYDCFLICGDNGFNQQEANLARIFSEQNLNYYFVKTKFDNDLMNAEQNSGTQLTLEQVEVEINRIKQNVEKIFEIRFGLRNSRERIFIISAMVNRYRRIDNRRLYDFPLLQRNIISNMMTEEKKHSLIMAFLPLVKEDVLAKCETLRQRINLISTYSSVDGLSPIPGTSLALDLTLILNELTIYVRSLNISKNKFEQMANSFGIEYAAIENNILENHQLVKTVIEINDVPLISQDYLSTLEPRMISALINFLPNALLANAAEEALKLVPYLGSFAGLVISFSTTQVILRNILKEFETTIIEVVEYCAKNKRI